MKKKIGLVLAFNKGSNYGTVLQSYATQYIVEKMECDTEIIDYYPIGTQIKKSLGAFVYLGVCLFKRTLNKATTKKDEEWDERHKANKKEREQIAREFCSRRLHNVLFVKGEKALKAYSTCYDAVLVGSDQNWLPHVSFTDFYTLRFAAPNVTRISYSTSMGVDKFPWYTHRQAKKYLVGIDYLSVREEQAKTIIKNICGKEAKMVLDPAYVVTKSEWETLIPYEPINKENYIFSFFLGKNVKFKKKIREYADAHNLRVVCVLSSEVCEDDTFYADEVLTGQTPENFVNLIRNATCIFTDSFHCLAFSIMNEKQVYVTYRIRAKKKSRNSRIDNIVNKLGIEHRLLKDADAFRYDIKDIDFSLVNEKLRVYREFSLQFLANALYCAGEKKTCNTIESDIYATKEDCCGCAACSDVCPMNIISMKQDQEGFLYPLVVDKSKCIHCNKCISVCPEKNLHSINTTFLSGYAGWSKKDFNILASSSGGAAHSLYESFVKSGGVVYGASYLDDFSDVEFSRSECVDCIEKFRGSKYSQANKAHIYQSVKRDLNNGQRVLFIGTPCETFAVKRFIGYSENLFLVCIICHGPTSPKVQKSFCLELQDLYHSNIVDFSLRHKKNEKWKPYYVRAKFDNGTEFLKPFAETDYNVAFQYFKRPSCSVCKFKNNKVYADLIVGDFHAAHKGSDNYNEKGVSVLIPTNQKGESLLKNIRDSFYFEEVDLKRCVNSNLALFSPVYKSTDREIFAANLNEYGLRYACSQYPIKDQYEKEQKGKNKKSKIYKIIRIIKYSFKIK